MKTVYESPYRTICLQDGMADSQYPVPLWLSRMCVGEGGKKCTPEHCCAMIWALINRYLLHPFRDNWPNDFISFVMAFSQPINPRWQYGGDLAIKNKSSDAKLRRRKSICEMEMHDIPDDITSTVYDMINGKIGITMLSYISQGKRISNWCANSRSARKRYPYGINIGDNWFLEDPDLCDGEVVIIQVETDMSIDVHPHIVPDPFYDTISTVCDMYDNKKDYKSDDKNEIFVTSLLDIYRMWLEKK